VSGFLIDTNIISAFAKPEVNEPAIDWLKIETRGSGGPGGDVAVR
jgi:predicted nucleic acid-binding protein